MESLIDSMSILLFKMKTSTRLIYSSSAFFWDGSVQLSGVLELWDTEIKFIFEDFQHSHLNLKIQLDDIKICKSFLLFNVAQKGLKIISVNGKVDMFILEDSKEFYKILEQHKNS